MQMCISGLSLERRGPRKEEISKELGFLLQINTMFQSLQLREGFVPPKINIFLGSDSETVFALSCDFRWKYIHTPAMPNSGWMCFTSKEPVVFFTFFIYLLFSASPPTYLSD